MTTPKIPTTSLNDSRIYLWDGGRYPSVTSVVGMLPKTGLQFWIAKTVAQAAIDMSDVGLAPQQKDHHWLKTAANRERDQAARVGTNIHEIVEHLAAGEEVDIPFEAEGFVDGFYSWRDKFQPEWVMAEETVFGWYDNNDDIFEDTPHGYAGSFDAIVDIKDETWLIDYKTTRSGVHPEVALQLSAYANAESVIRPDGTTAKIPDIDRFGVLWLRPDNWSFVEINAQQTPRDPFFHVFGALLGTWHWENGLSKTALLPPLASGGSRPRAF